MLIQFGQTLGLNENSNSVTFPISFISKCSIVITPQCRYNTIYNEPKIPGVNNLTESSFHIHYAKGSDTQDVSWRWIAVGY